MFTMRSGVSRQHAFVFVLAMVMLELVVACHKPVHQADLTTVEGTLTSFEEKRSAGSPYLELYVDGRTTRFRVPVDWYSKAFDARSFHQAVHTGTSVSLLVEKQQLAKPLEPATDHVPTVFVYGLSSGSTVFLPAQVDP